ncbi:hypothetical protein HDU86_005052 [Geranomyces michiganensis]|nr:hypothetical protein HDU86_005052 [Geranomyces michiganensis]
MPVDASNPAKVTLTQGNASAEVYLFGATVTSWKVGGVEKIFVSNKAHLDGSKAIRGGIPLVFPHFGTIPTSSLPQHGFARVSTWSRLDPASETATETSVAFLLSPRAVPAALAEKWPHAFRLKYTVTLTADTLTTTLAAENTADVSWDFTALLHTYFNVKDVAKVGVKGLEGATFVDKVAEGAPRSVENRNAVTVAGEVDRVYEGVAKDEVTVTGTGQGDVTVRKNNLPDIVVWNPWTDKAKAMADFGDDEYHRMICVEAGSVAKFITLQPGETWTGGQTLKAE